MTESTQTLEQMQAEIAALKEQRIQELEMATAQRELDLLKAGKLPVETTAGNTAIAGEQIGDLKLARVRQGLNGLAHFISGPIASVYYGAKTGYWLPTLAATGVAVVAVPVAVIDLGFTLAVAPPLTSCLMMCNKSSEKRRQLGILMPEQADALMAKVTRF
jgi:hypothetical protein